MTKNLLDLAKNFEQTSSKQARHTEQAVQQGFQNLEQSLKNSLKQSENSINNAIQEITNDTQTKIRQAMQYKILVGSVMGFLASLIVILVLVLVWQGKTLKDRRSELSAIEQAVSATPVEQQALAKVKIGKNADGTIWIEPTKPKKAQIGTSTDGKPLMLLE